jgi:alpha 1,3-glucosidase
MNAMIVPRLFRICFYYLFLYYICTSLAVDHSNFKTCDQSGFCKRQRRMPVGRSLYVALLDTLEPIQVGNDSSSAPTRWRVAVENHRNSVRFWLELHLLAGRTVRFRITEANPLRERFEPPVGDVLVGEPRPTPDTASIERAPDGSSITLRVRASAAGAPDVSLRVLADPLRIDVLQAGELVLVANARGLLRFEHTRTQSEAAAADSASAGDQPSSTTEY